MKRIVLIAVLFFNIAAFAQDSSATRNREFYVTLADFSPLNIHLKYKHPIGERTYLKFGLVNLSGSRSENLPGNPSNSPATITNLAGGVEFGIEFRKQLTNKLSMFHGPNVRYTYQTSILDVAFPNQGNRTEGHIAGIPYTVGLLFQLAPNFSFAAEINPAINFTHIENRSGEFVNATNTFNFSLDNRGGLLSLVLRF